jgi:XTP/dITP diphosphohydrolase
MGEQESASAAVPRRELPPRVALATRNRHKITEILAICSDWPVMWLTDDAHWPEVDETGETYLDNALLKARAVAAATGLLALADDSGIEADALCGAPGPRSARFAGDGASDQQNLDLLLRRVAGAEGRSAGEGSSVLRTCRYRCIAVIAWPDGDALWAEGTCEGRLIDEPRGSGGFGYDPAFVPRDEDESGRGRTMAELPADEKHAISHRGRAFRALRRLLDPPPPSAAAR